MKKKISLFLFCLFLLNAVGCGNTPPYPSSETHTTTEETRSSSASSTRPVTPAPSLSAELVVSAPSELEGPLLEIGRIYSDQRENLTITFRFGESGEIISEVRRNAPVDVLITSQEFQLEELEDAGFLYKDDAVSLGTNDMFLLTNPSVADLDFFTLSDERVTEIAICDPKASFFGKSAAEILSYQKIADKKVILPSPDQVIEYVKNTEGAMGILARTEIPKEETSAVLAEKAAADWYVPISYHASVLPLGEQWPLAEDFVIFLNGKDAQDIFRATEFLPATAATAGNGTASTRKK